MVTGFDAAKFSNGEGNGDGSVLADKLELENGVVMEPDRELNDFGMACPSSQTTAPAFCWIKNESGQIDHKACPPTECCA